MPAFWSAWYVQGWLTHSKSLQNLFVITPLNWDEWKAVLYISLPIVLLDEALKFVSQTFIAPPAKIKQE